MKDPIGGLEKTNLAELDTAGSAAKEGAEIQAAYVMARRFPREEARCLTKLLATCQRVAFAEEAEYHFPRGATEVSGKSAPFAREAARIWGNVRWGLRILRDDEETRLIRGWALDLETNTYDEAEDEFRKLIYRKAGGWVVPDERDLRELTNRRGAILIRNCLLSILPKEYTDDGVATCEKTLAASAIKDLPVAIRRMTAAFAESGVTENDIERYLGHPLSMITGKEIVALRGVHRAIRDGVAKKEEFFAAERGRDAQQDAPEGSLDMSKLATGEGETFQGHD